MRRSVLETWLQTVLEDYADHILDFTAHEAQVWGKLRVPHPQNALDKMIAATALTCGLTLVTRNVNDFTGTGVPLIDPFETVESSCLKTPVSRLMGNAAITRPKKFVSGELRLG